MKIGEKWRKIHVMRRLGNWNTPAASKLLAALASVCAEAQPLAQPSDDQLPLSVQLPGVQLPGHPEHPDKNGVGQQSFRHAELCC